MAIVLSGLVLADLANPCAHSVMVLVLYFIISLWLLLFIGWIYYIYIRHDFFGSQTGSDASSAATRGGQHISSITLSSTTDSVTTDSVSDLPA